MYGGFMFEVLTGQTPWYWLTSSAVHRRRLTNNTNTVDDAKANGKLTYIVQDGDKQGTYVRALEELMCGCLSVEASRRPDMKSVLSRLGQILHGIGKHSYVE